MRWFPPDDARMLAPLARSSTLFFRSKGLVPVAAPRLSPPCHLRLRRRALLLGRRTLFHAQIPIAMTHRQRSVQALLHPHLAPRNPAVTAARSIWYNSPFQRNV